MRSWPLTFSALNGNLSYACQEHISTNFKVLHDTITRPTPRGRFIPSSGRRSKFSGNILCSFFLLRKVKKFMSVCQSVCLSRSVYLSVRSVTVCTVCLHSLFVCLSVCLLACLSKSGVIYGFFAPRTLRPMEGHFAP